MHSLTVILGFAALAAALPKHTIVTVTKDTTVTSTSTTTIALATSDPIDHFAATYIPSPTVAKRGGFDFPDGVFQLSSPLHPDPTPPSGVPSHMPYDGMPLDEFFRMMHASAPAASRTLHPEPAKEIHENDLIAPGHLFYDSRPNDEVDHHDHGPLVLDEDAPEENTDTTEPPLVARWHPNPMTGMGRDPKDMSMHELKNMMEENLAWDGTCEDDMDLCEYTDDGDD